MIHHVMGRGVDGTEIFRDNVDRDDFLSRIANIADKEQIHIYAFALMPIVATIGKGTCFKIGINPSLSKKNLTCWNSYAIYT